MMSALQAGNATKNTMNDFELTLNMRLFPFQGNSFLISQGQCPQSPPSLHFVFLVGLALILIGMQFHGVWEEMTFLETSAPWLSRDFSEIEK